MPGSNETGNSVSRKMRLSVANPPRLWFDSRKAENSLSRPSINEILLEVLRTTLVGLVFVTRTLNCAFWLGATKIGYIESAYTTEGTGANRRITGKG